MGVSMKDIVKPFCVLKKIRKPFQTAVFAEAGHIAKHCLWRLREKPIQRDQAVTPSLSILDDVILNDSFVDHAKSEPNSGPLAVRDLDSGFFCASLTILFTVNQSCRTFGKGPSVSDAVSTWRYETAKAVNRRIHSLRHCGERSQCRRKSCKVIPDI